MTDTFFDLQRFAVTHGVLVGSESYFTWEDPAQGFAPGGTSIPVGTQANPAHLSELTGVGVDSVAGTGTEVYLSGEKTYSFSLKDKEDWSMQLGSDNVLQVTGGESGLALGTLDGEDAAVLTIKGEFNEALGANITTTEATTAKLTAEGVITFDKAVNGAEIELDAGESVLLNKGGDNVVINSTNADGTGFNDIDIKKKVTLTSDGTVAQIITGNNSITIPNGNVVEIKADKDTNVTIGSDQVISGVTKGVTVKTATDGVVVPTTVNDVVWDEISGGVSSIAFDSLGSAVVDNTGAVVIDGQAGAEATVKDLSQGATVNDIKVGAAEKVTVGFTLETVEAGATGGISAIDVSKALGKEITVNKDYLFDVNAGKTSYEVFTAANAITFAATASQIDVDVANEQIYAVDGGKAYFDFVDATTATLNAAAVSVKTTEGVFATASGLSTGVDVIGGLKAGEAVSVSGDSDGFTAAFNEVESDAVVDFVVNDASIMAGGISGQSVNIAVDSTGKNVTVTGMIDTTQVSVGGAGITYHFKDASSDNEVTTNSAGEAMYVTLDSTGGIADSIDEYNYKKLMENDAGKWIDVATVGSVFDSVPANHADAYNQFYDLDTSAAGAQTIATFANEDDTVAATVSNPNGVQIFGRNTTKTLAENGHITLTAGSNVGAAPLNIQSNESDAVYDVVVDLSGAGAASTVAVGTLGEVDASHEIHLSNAGVGYAFVGEGATGQNKIFAGTAGAQIRHDGDRATIAGNRSADTIWAGKYDIVSGGAGADQFYDSADYTITDYNAAEGDALIATRLVSVDDVNKDNIKYDYNAGNEVSFGSSRNSFTIGQNQNDSLYLNVAIMNADADVVGSRNVVLAGANGGAVDASALTGGALIIADESRNGNSGDNVIGTGYADQIFVGANDTVNGGAGNDSITIDTISAGDAGAVVAIGSGKNTVSGWQFGFDKNAGATELIAGEGYRGSFENDRLLVTDANGSMLFDDTAATSNHGEYNVIINGTKFMAIRTNDENNTNPDSYGEVEDNSQLADVYIAERAGILTFDKAVTENLGTIDLASTKYQNIRTLVLNNNSKAVVLGANDRETVALGGDASVGAQKEVSLGAGNNVIISGGDDTASAGHTLYFGAGDGRDSVFSFSHYVGAPVDPDQQYADTLVLEEYNGLYTGTGEDGGSRIEFVTGDDSRVFLYESEGISVDNIYQVKVGDGATKLTKIGNSGNAANVFAYNADVDYYVGSSAENAADTLTVGNEIANARIWLDGSSGDQDEYYRGIAVVDAGANTNTDIEIAGAGNNNTLYAGGEGTNNSLWGGAGDNELFGSTAGRDTFFYVRSAGAYLAGVDDDVTGGNDEVYNYDLDNGDIVWLGDTTVDDILNTEVTDNSVSVNFKNGGSITVNGTDDVRFLINQGTESWVTSKDSSGDKFVKES